MEHGSNALDLSGNTFFPTMSVALPNSGIDLVLVLNDESAAKIPLDDVMTKVRRLFLMEPLSPWKPRSQSTRRRESCLNNTQLHAQHFTNSTLTLLAPLVFLPVRCLSLSSPGRG